MKRLRVLYLVLPVLALLAVGIAWLAVSGEDVREEIVITIPYTENIREIDTNYYKQWLEEQTGLSIKFNIVREARSADYLRSMFASGYVKSDAFFSIPSGADYAEWNAVIEEFGEKGYIIPLNKYIDQSVYMNEVFQEFTDYDLRDAMTSPDGNIYYMPGLDPSMPERNFQIMWLNERWLKTLGLTLPQTTEDLRAVLEAFRDRDPNGNGIRDEIPLAGSNDVESERIYNFIINAFVYNNPNNSYLYAEDGEVRFAPVTDEWREAMIYLNSLYADNLIDPFSFEHDRFSRLANDAGNMLGGFTSRSITDIVFQTNPELINDFSHIAPLIGPDGVQNATIGTPLPRPAGIITSACENPEAVFKLFDLMLSEEAFLIGRYGEENIDWVRGNTTDIDFYGRNAAIRVINRLQDVSQNKHLCEIGPFFAYQKYSDSVSFSGMEADQVYVNARAYRVYTQYEPAGYIETMSVYTGKSSDLQTLRNYVDVYTDESIRVFITGEVDPSNDSAWASHLQKYQELGVQNLIDAVTEELP